MHFQKIAPCCLLLIFLDHTLEKVILQLTPVAKSANRNREVPRPCSSERSRPDSSEIEFDLLKLHSLVTDHAVDLPCDRLNWQLLKRIVNELDELVGAA